MLRWVHFGRVGASLLQSFDWLLVRRSPVSLAVQICEAMPVLFLPAQLQRNNKGTDPIQRPNWTEGSNSWTGYLPNYCLLPCRECLMSGHIRTSGNDSQIQHRYLTKPADRAALGRCEIHYCQAGINHTCRPLHAQLVMWHILKFIL